MIEKIIHQIWIQGEEYIPEKLKPNQKRILTIHGEWRYMFWDEIKILTLLHSLENPEWINKYYQFMYIHQKIDFAKLAILYHYGGIFIDMDAYTQQSLDPLFERCENYDFVVSKIKPISELVNYMVCGDQQYCINNGVYLGKSGADILRYLMDASKTECNLYDTKVNCIRKTTGPLIFDQLIKEYLSTNSTSKILILPYHMLEPCIYNDCDILNDTYVVHQHENTWVNQTSQSLMKHYVKHSKCYDTILYIVSLILIISIIFVFYKIYRR